MHDSSYCTFEEAPADASEKKNMIQVVQYRTYSTYDIHMSDYSTWASARHISYLRDRSWKSGTALVSGRPLIAMSPSSFRLRGFRLEFNLIEEAPVMSHVQL